MQDEIISVEELQGISIFSMNDLYDLAVLMLKVCRVKDSRKSYNVKSYPTLHGVAGQYCMLFGVDQQQIEDMLKSNGFSVRCMIDFEGDINVGN